MVTNVINVVSVFLLVSWGEMNDTIKHQERSRGMKQQIIKCSFCDEVRPTIGLLEIHWLLVHVK